MRLMTFFHDTAFEVTTLKPNEEEEALWARQSC
jgi:hypothetical protein